ncbi:methylated-DNA--[protein]-cysteine S-methyltransferase [Desulfurobacterium sp.]
MTTTVIVFSFGIAAVVKHNGHTVVGVRLTAEIPEKSETAGFIAKNFLNYEKTGSVIVPFRENLLSPFQKNVFSAVKSIPPGKTATYGEIAATVGTSPRAVGQALKRNPFPLIIPCHRVVASKGTGGFSQGTEIKEKLLLFEKHHFT